MRTAFPYWQSRLAPVFDTARQILLVDFESAEITGQSDEILPETQPSLKILRLVELKIDTLVCGAISRPLRQMAAAHGIAVTPFIAGELEEIVSSWVAGRLETEIFAMPGCCQGLGRRLRGQGMDRDHPCTAEGRQPATTKRAKRRFRGE
jgi:predicted Fe-Mo cluster-binding NifX family protein